jgi:DNA-binding MarR family transcriptional regulator
MKKVIRLATEKTNKLKMNQVYSEKIYPLTPSPSGRGRKNNTFENQLHDQLFYFEKVLMLSEKDEIKNHLGSSIIYTGRLISNLINNHFTCTGANITFEQMGVLFFIVLKSDQEIIQQDLAAMLNKNKSAVLRTIDLLEKKGYVKRKSVPNDRRKNIIESTLSGVKIVKEALRTSHKFEKEYTRKISERDIKTCMKVLNIIQQECKK